MGVICGWALFLRRRFHLRQKSERVSAFLSCLPFPLMKLTNYQVITGVLASALFGEVNFLPPSFPSGWGAREGTNFRNERRLLRRERMCTDRSSHIPSSSFPCLPLSFSRRENQELRHRAYYVQYRGGCRVVPQSSWENRATHVSRFFHVSRLCTRSFSLTL